MHSRGTGRILLDKTQDIDHAYVEIYPDGQVRAGYFKDTAKLYKDVDQAYERFRESYNYSKSPSSWNICACLEEHFPRRRRGR